MRYAHIKEYKKDIALSIILTLLTCGIYNLFWQKHQMKTVNLLLEKEVLSFWKWLFLTIITCGLYHIYYEYLMGKYIVEIQHKVNKLPYTSNLFTIALILSALGLSIVVDAIEQRELNEIIDYLVSKEKHYG